MAADVNPGASGLVAVDIDRLSEGLKTVFHGISEIFESIGADTGAAMIQSAAEAASAGKTAAAKQEPVEKLKPSKKKAVEKPAEESKAEKTEKEAVPKAAADSKDPAKKSTITFEDLQKISSQKVLENRANTEKLQKIVTSFGITKLSDLPEDQYEAFMTQLTTL